MRELVSMIVIIFTLAIVFLQISNILSGNSKSLFPSIKSNQMDRVKQVEDQFYLGLSLVTIIVNIVLFFTGNDNWASLVSFISSIILAFAGKFYPLLYIAIGNFILFIISCIKNGISQSSSSVLNVVIPFLSFGLIRIQTLGNDFSLSNSINKVSFRIIPFILQICIAILVVSQAIKCNKKGIHNVFSIASVAIAIFICMGFAVNYVHTDIQTKKNKNYEVETYTPYFLLFSNILQFILMIIAMSFCGQINDIFSSPESIVSLFVVLFQIGFFYIRYKAMKNLRYFGESNEIYITKFGREEFKKFLRILYDKNEINFDLNDKVLKNIYNLKYMYDELSPELSEITNNKIEFELYKKTLNEKRTQEFNMFDFRNEKIKETIQNNFKNFESKKLGYMSTVKKEKTKSRIDKKESKDENDKPDYLKNWTNYTKRELKFDYENDSELNNKRKSEIRENITKKLNYDELDEKHRPSSEDIGKIDKSFKTIFNLDQSISKYLNTLKIEKKSYKFVVKQILINFLCTGRRDQIMLEHVNEKIKDKFNTKSQDIINKLLNDKDKQSIVNVLNRTKKCTKNK